MTPAEGLDFLRESLGWVVQEVMEAEVSELIGAERVERTQERLTHRSGYRARAWQTRAGELELAILALIEVDPEVVTEGSPHREEQAQRRRSTLSASTSASS
jgi:transposase-like protein